MSQVESIEEKGPYIPTCVIDQQVESESSDSYNASCGTESSVDEKMSLSLGDVSRSHGNSLPRDSYTLMLSKNENMTENNRIGDQFRTSVESQSGERTDFQLGGAFGGTDIESDSRLLMQSSSKSDDSVLKDGRHIPGPDGVSSERFKNVCKENASSSQQLAGLEQTLAKKQSGEDVAQMDSRWQALEIENFRLKKQLQEICSKLILDENGYPMEPKEVLYLREENERLANKISLLEKGLDEPQNISPVNSVQHNPSPESSVMVVPHIDGLIQEIKELKAANDKLSVEKTKLEREVQEMRHTVTEIIDASPDVLQKRLKAEKDRNRRLEEECKMLKIQIDTYAEDFRVEKEQQRIKESSWDTRFTRLRASSDKLKREVKDKDMEIMRLGAQYQKEFESKMKIQEDFEKQKHVPPKATTSTPGPYQSSQRSFMMSDESFELITCEVCSIAFSSPSELESHRQTCCIRGRKHGGYQTQV